MKTLIIAALVAASSSAPMAQEIVEFTDQFVLPLAGTEERAPLTGAAGPGEIFTQGEITLFSDTPFATGSSRSDVRAEGQQALRTHARGTVYDSSYEN